MILSRPHLVPVVVATLLAGGLSAPEAAVAKKPTQAAAASSDPLPRRAFLGTQVAPVSAATRARQTLADSTGVEIVRVFPGSSAEAAKLRAGDVVVSIDKTPVGSTQEFVRTVGSKRGKASIELVLWRDGSRRTQRVSLLPMPREESPEYEVEYGSVASSGGRLRLIWTRPRGDGDRRPALFLIQGVGAFSVENVPPSTGGYASIIDDFTRRGYVTLRVDKPGCGDSEGGPLQDVDFDTQLDGFRQALRALRSDPGVDPDRILIFGHSMGGVWGPLLAMETPVQGIAVYGTLARTWLEYTLENERRQSTLAGISAGAIDSSITSSADAHYWLNRKGLPPAEAIERDPSLQAWVDSSLTQGTYYAGLHYRFLHQIASKNLGAAWAAFPGHALALWGRGDFVSSEDDHRLIASIVNRAHPGRGEFRVLETSDHGFQRSSSERESWDRRGQPGEFNPEIVAVLREWSSRVSMATSGAGSDLSAVYDAALAGDMAKGLSILESVDPSRLSAKDSTAAACLRSTFTHPPSLEDLPAGSRRILHAYRLYWQNAMLRRMATADAERTLLDSLNAALKATPDGPAATLDDASERARLVIRGEGLFALAGVTSPFYELMIWRTQIPSTYHVKLPGRTVDVPVVFLDDFVSLGWAGFATCGRSHSGGWATKDSLFALRSAYDLESENFRVSYLAHEGTHFADYKRYPKLQQPELEYRAKLTELAVSAETTHGLITGFARRNGLDRSVPHHFANYWVAADMSRAVFRSDSLVTDPEKWRRTSGDRLRREARKLLEKCDARLQKLGASKVERFLSDRAG